MLGISKESNPHLFLKINSPFSQVEFPASLFERESLSIATSPLTPEQCLDWTKTWPGNNVDSVPGGGTLNCDDLLDPMPDHAPENAEREGDTGGEDMGEPYCEEQYHNHCEYIDEPIEEWFWQNKPLERVYRTSVIRHYGYRRVTDGMSCQYTIG